MVLRLLGTAVTDANGLAVLPDGYTGTGAGEIDVVAKTEIDDRILQSEPYTVWDTLMYDNIYTSSKWTLGTNITEEDGDGYAIFKSSGSNSSNGRSYSNATFTGDIEAIFEANITQNSSWLFMFGFRASSNHSLAILNESGWKYCKIKRVNGVCTAYKSSDGVNWTALTMDSDNVGSATVSFELYIYSGVVTDPRTVQFKNLKIYSL